MKAASKVLQTNFTGARYAFYVTTAMVNDHYISNCLSVKQSKCSVRGVILFHAKKLRTRNFADKCTYYLPILPHAPMPVQK